MTTDCRLLKLNLIPRAVGIQSQMVDSTHSFFMTLPNTAMPKQNKWNVALTSHCFLGIQEQFVIDFLWTDHLIKFLGELLKQKRLLKLGQHWTVLSNANQFWRLFPSRDCLTLNWPMRFTTCPKWGYSLLLKPVLLVCKVCILYMHVFTYLQPWFLWRQRQPGLIGEAKLTSQP